MTEAIEQILVERSGFDPQAFGRGAIERAMAARMEACGISELPAYLDRLHTSKQELESLLEELTIPETWFFRDRGPFEFLERYARDLCSIRILSAPCASGEEPFSIAMTLLQAGLSPKAFHIDACDISQQLLHAASQAVYGPSSFREEWRDHRNRWFRLVEGGFALSRDITSLVQFHRDDLLHPGFLASQPAYDIAFCRNLLIYLRPEAQQTVIENIGRLMKADGIVVTGHAEVPVLVRGGYDALLPAQAFACRKAAPWRVPKAAPCQKRCIVPAVRPSALATPPVSPAQEGCETIEHARRLADDGLTAAAWAICEEVLAQGPNADAYYLQGLISAERDRWAAAEEYFRRALYLDPAHYDALVHTSLLYERLGNPERSALFRRRAARISSAQNRVDHV